jgi:cyclic-di-GMP phosphodiesterase TipF (flagellum assembly factor)
MASFAFLAFCYVIIALSVTYGVHIVSGLPLMSIAPLVFALVWLLSVGHLYVQQRRDRKDLKSRFEVFSQALNHHQNHAELLQGAVKRLEKTSSSQALAVQNQSHEEVEILKSDVTTLSMMVQQLTEAVTELDERVSSPLLHLAQGPLASQPASHAYDPIYPSVSQLQEKPLSLSASVATTMPVSLSGQINWEKGQGGFQSSSKNDETRIRPQARTTLALQDQDNQHTRQILDHVRECVREGKIDLALQPIVSLPQRKPRFYECLAQLRLADKHALEARSAIPVIEAAGVAEEFDLAVLGQALSIAQRLGSRNSQLKLFVNLSHQSLLSQSFVDSVTERLKAAGAVTRHLVLEIRQACWEEASPLEKEALLTFREAGCCLSMDHVRRLEFDIPALAQSGFRYLKLPADLVLSLHELYRGDIHPDDFPAYCARKDITLIAEHIEQEPVLREVLEYDIHYAQGYLFGRPKVISLLQPSGADQTTTQAGRTGQMATPQPPVRESVTSSASGGSGEGQKVRGRKEVETSAEAVALSVLNQHYGQASHSDKTISPAKNAEKPREEKVSSTASLRPDDTAPASERDAAELSPAQLARSIRSSTIPEDAIEDILHSVRGQSRVL